MKIDDIKCTLLNNGLKVITQKADFNKVFIGAWVKTGLVNESDEENGLSHFLEHMLFKGTTTKTAIEISDYIERLGGECNAYTATESTVIHTSLLPEHWKFGVDFLADVIRNSTFPENEIERERNVIMQEIAMYENDPMSEMFTQFMGNVYKDDAFGRNILGPRKNITKFTRGDLVNYWSKWYVPNNIVISACGDINHDEFIDYVADKFVPDFDPKDLTKPDKNTFKLTESRKQNVFSQSQFILAKEGLGIHANEKDKLTYDVLTNIIDGGMSCRLFQEIREKHGLAYEVGLVKGAMENTGYFGVHALLDEVNINKAVDLSKKVLASVKDNITDEEIEKAKNSILYSMASSYDSCSRLTSTNGSCLLFDVKRLSYEDVRRLLKTITKEDLFEFANKNIPNPKDDGYSLTIMTPYNKE